MYTILGATGNTGSIIANTLLANKQNVRVVGRSANKLQSFVSKGAEAFVADLTDAEALTRAFTRIGDSKMRRSIVELVEQIASRDGPDQR